MARSIWKLPYISPAITRLLKRESKKSVTDLNTSKKKNITISTYSRNTVIIPALLDKTIKVYIVNNKGEVIILCLFTVFNLILCINKVKSINI